MTPSKCGACVSLIVVLVLCVPIGFSIGLLAQTVASGTIQGTVSDPSGAVIPNATVVVRNVDTSLERNLVSGPAGRYVASSLPPGKYEVKASAPGFAELLRTGIQLDVGSVVTVELTLPVGAAQEVVTVSGETPLVEPTKTESSMVVNQLAVANLPISGRRWEDFVLLTPTVNADGGYGLVSYRGINGLYNNNMVDGADNNQAFFSETRGLTRLQYVYSQDAIQEFQVINSNYSAEFGRAAGGVVNAITKSGGNEFHGDVFYFIRDSAWLAQDSLAKARGQDKPSERRQQFGGSLGGPIKRDKLFFFVNYDQQVHNTPVTVVPSRSDFFDSCDTVNFLAECQAAIFNPSGPPALIQSLSGLRPRKRDQNAFLVKGDWVINDKHRLNGVFNLLDWRSPNGIYTDPVVSVSAEAQGFDGVKDEFVIFTLQSLPTPSVINELRFHYGRDFEFERANNGPPVTIVDGGIDFGMHLFLPRPAFPNEKRFQWTDNISWSKGRHTLKAGVDINYVDEKIENLFLGGGFYLYIPLFGQSAATNFALDFADPSGRRYLFFQQSVDPVTGRGLGQFSTTDFNWYVQDNIQVTRKLYVQAGLRYELQLMPSVVRPNPQVPMNSTLNTDTNNFGPRFGLAYSIDDKTVLRTGYGLYYGRTQNSSIHIHLFQNGASQQAFTFLFFDCAGPEWPNLVFPPPPASPSAPVAAGAPPTQVQTPPVGCPVSPGSSVVSTLTPDFVNPLLHQAELSIEREVFPDWSVSASYLMSRGLRLPLFRDSNVAPTTQSVSYAVADSGGNIVTTFDEPFYTNRIDPNLGVILTGESAINTWYHGVVLAVSKRFSKGFQMNAHLTVSKSTDTGHVAGDVGTFGGSVEMEDPYNIRREKALSNLDVRRVLVVSAYWELPWKDLTSPAAKIFVNNWKASTVWRFRDGFPVDPRLLGQPGCPVNGGLTCGAVDWFGSPAGARAGFLGRNTFTGPGLANVDLRIARDFPISESKRIEFIWEAFNLFNRTNVTQVEDSAFNFIDPGGLMTPSATCPLTVNGCLVPRSDFLTPTATGNRLNRARQMQFALKFFF